MPRIFENPMDVTGRLYELGLTEAQLAEAVQYAIGYVVECTLFDPASTAGFLAYAKTVRGLRDRLVPLGWHAESERGFETTSHPDRTHSLGVAGGNQNVGLSDKTPATRTDKGPATRSAVGRNFQAGLWEYEPSFGGPPADQPTPYTWLLLQYVDEEEGEVRIELSLPSGMSEDGRVTEWEERIILSPISYVPTPQQSDEDAGDDEDIDFDVPRRTG